MKVDRVTTVVRYSAETQGSWRSIEVGAEAVLNASDETLESAQTELYHRLSQQLKALWANGNGKANSTQPAPRSDAPPAQAPAPPPDRRWCQTHRVEFKRFGKNGKTWYSHRLGDGNWCNQAKQS
jgi:hypothetical protein